MIYESARDRENERRVLRKVAGAWRSEVVFHEPLHHVDSSMVVDGKVVAYAEARVRSCRSNAFRELMWRAAKWRDCKRLSHQTGLPVFLVIEWTDKTGFIKVAGEYQRKIGGHNNRGNPLDREICIYIPVSKFKFFKEAA